MSRRSPARRRRVAVVSGTRAEYGVLRSTLRALARRRAHLELQLIVTGMHLLPRFGRTIDQVRTDGFKVAARVPMQRGDDHTLDQAEGLGRGVAGIARALQRLDSDIVLVLGDRIEALAGALAGVTTGRCVAHVHGGDLAEGDFDDALRHAISKLAHVHFAATPASARRLIRMGERPQQVHVVGRPGLDELMELAARHARASRNPVDAARAGRRKLGTAHPALRETPRALIVQHAYGRAADVERRVALDVFRAVRDAGLAGTVIFPNSDRGSAGVLRAIADFWRELGPDAADWRRVKSLPRDEYLSELLKTRVLVGNSSSGIVEAPAIGVPVVNIGQRQAGRERSGRGVIDCEESPAAIRAAVRRAVRRRAGRGARSLSRSSAGERIADLLANGELPPLRKRNRY